MDDNQKRKRENHRGYMQKYRKKEQNKRIAVSGLNEDETNNNERKKIQREYMRKYREKKNQDLIDINNHNATISDPLVINADRHNEKKRKRTEYMRQYREKKKNQELFVENNQPVATNDLLVDINLPSTSEISSVQGPCHHPKIQNDSSSSEHTEANVECQNLPYSSFLGNSKAHKDFSQLFIENQFGHACSVCDRLWFLHDLQSPKCIHHDTLEKIIPNYLSNTTLLCGTCSQSLAKNKIPTYSTTNGFKYHDVPANLPPLDLLSERLISPRIPFMQIRRLRHVNGQYGIYGQIINVPVDVNTMVSELPRQVDDDYCINVHLKKKLIHKSSYLHGIIKKNVIKTWLRYLIDTPLYKMYHITINNEFFDSNDSHTDSLYDITENIPIEECLIGQQQTLAWNEDKYLQMAPGQNNVPQSILFDEYAEELSFPSIYLGQFRKFHNLKVTPFMMMTSELRRSDRRAVTPQHLLYLAMKIMRLRVRDSLTVAFKHVGKNTNVTREQIESDEYINSCIESNLAFLRSIPNSAWYWSQRKKDLFAMIRTLGKPTVFLTMSANEIGWPDLLRTLHKLKHKNEILNNDVSALHYIDKSTLINEDAVTCAVYFNKLVNVIIKILRSKTHSPFKQFRVVEYFKRIEFQHRGSPHAHILLWLEHAPQDPINVDYDDTITLIDTLTSVSAAEASGNIKLQTHKHTFTCYKTSAAKKKQQCRFEAPFMPSKNTKILVPMQKEETGFSDYKKRYTQLKENLEKNNYEDFTDFYAQNSITSDDDYSNVLRAGIIRPRVFNKRSLSEVWYNSFNPFILNVLKSNMDIQFITEEYSCAAYVVEYINKTNRGISNLQRQIIDIKDEHPEFDIVEVTRKMSINMLNNVEMSSQEAAWYLLREPISKCSTIVTYIPTVWPVERERIRKSQKELDALGSDFDSTNIWKENFFDKYEKRSEELQHVTLAQFVSKYNIKGDGSYVMRKQPRIIRYRNYDLTDEFNEYRREMVTLHIPFKNEEEEILAELKFIQIYDSNEQLILQRRKEFESNIDINKTLEICKKLCRELDAEKETDEVANIPMKFPEPNPFDNLYNNPHSVMNVDLHLATLNKLGAIVKKRENIMPTDQFCELMRMANNKQRELLLHVISHLQADIHDNPLQIFLTGPAGCGKTFVIKLLMEIYNRYTNTDGLYNAFITCASTGKAAVAIDGTTIHTALKISLSKLQHLSVETCHQYRSLFKFVHVLIVDEISMVGAELLSQIDSRLKQITGNFNSNFGGLDMIFIGDLRQLPPVRATPIYKQLKQRIEGPILWRSLKFYELTQVMRQANVLFSSLLTKIGNGLVLNEEEQTLIESRFFTKNETNRLCPDGVRLFLDNNSVSLYNNFVLNTAPKKITSTAVDIYTGYHNDQQLAFIKQKLHKMSVIDTSGLPYEIIFVVGKRYVITANIDVSDGLANGASGQLLHVEEDKESKITRVWLSFNENWKTGAKIRMKAAAYIEQNNLSHYAVPIERRTATISLNSNKTIIAKRNHFPLISACAMTIHKSQGGTFDQIVYEYDKKHAQQLLYVALSRVTTIEGLFIVTKSDNDFKFYHGMRAATSIVHLQDEFKRLSNSRLQTQQMMLIDFIRRSPGLSIFSFNCQSLRKHVQDLSIDAIVKETDILMLSETWLRDEERVDIPNFHWIVQYKRQNIRAGGVAIYKNTNNNNNMQVVTPNMKVQIPFSESTTVRLKKSIGDICIAECVVQNFDKPILLVSVYISPNQTFKQISEYIMETLLMYSVDGARILNKNYDTIPMILSGDFNINFASEQGMKLTQFLKNNFYLELNNNALESTTRSNTTIDVVFSRHLENFQSRVFISYFSYHKPIVSKLSDNA